MKNSDRNLMVIQNFILHITGCEDSYRDLDYDETFRMTPRELYEAAQEYIQEDHIDGKGNSQD